MTESDTVKAGPLRWLVVGVAVTLTVLTLGLIARALLGGPAPQASQSSLSAAIETTVQPGAIAPAAQLADEEEGPLGETAPVDAGPVQTPAAQQQQPPSVQPGGSAAAALTAKSAGEVVDRLLAAVHDGDVSAGQLLITDDFLSVVGGAEWLAAGPDALKAWKVTDSTAEDGFVWVSVTETWDYGTQKTRYMVIDFDGQIRIDAAEWGL